MASSGRGGPGRTWAHSLNNVGSRVLMFGGCDDGGNSIDATTPLLYDIGGYAWITDVEISGASEEQSPGRRYGHKSVTLGMHPATVMIYGGLVIQAQTGTYEGFEPPDHLEDSFSSDYDGHVGGEDPRSGLEEV